jgi:hypothetical protein
MSERERWVVYPLLFLALGAALRDKLVDRTTAKSIVCQELTIVDEEPDGHNPVHVLAKIGRSSEAPGLGVLAVNGEVSVDGIVKVNGVVNAKQYALQGRLLTPTFQAAPGMSIPDLLRALQAAQIRQQSNVRKDKPTANQPPANPSAEPAEGTPITPPEKSDSEADTQPKK